MIALTFWLHIHHRSLDLLLGSRRFDWLGLCCLFDNLAFRHAVVEGV